jgi:hypothetical protein
MRLRGVPEDEADEVRALLRDHALDVYETPPDRWGVSMPAIWLRDDSRADEARRLVKDYQHQRQQQAREQWNRLGREGRRDTVARRIRERPLRTLIFLALAAGVLYLSIKPFLALSE